MPIKAKLEGEWYLCGCCGHKLAKLIYKPTYPDDGFEIEIKCKHKSSGKKCDTINVIEI